MIDGNSLFEFSAIIHQSGFIGGVAKSLSATRNVACFWPHSRLPPGEGFKTRSPAGKSLFSLWKSISWCCMSKWDGLTNAHRYWHDLSAVTVVPEAMVLWNLSKWKLLRLLNEGKIAGVKAEHSGTWLISVACMLDLFGDPVVTPCDPPILVDWSPEIN